MTDEWLIKEALKVVGDLLDNHLERDASALHALVRRMREQAARIAELEAEIARLSGINKSLVNSHNTLNVDGARLEDRIAELEAERDAWRRAAGDLFHSSHADNVKLAKLEAERDYLRTAHTSAVVRIAELTKRLGEAFYTDDDVILTRVSRGEA